MAEQSIDDFLEHYGVRGMKWGVRRASSRSSGGKRTKKETAVRNKRQKLSKNRRTISDTELQKTISRMTEEKKLKALVSEDLKPGRTIAKKIMSDSGQKVARTVISGAGLYAIKVAVDKNFNLKEAAGYMTPKPKNK